MGFVILLILVAMTGTAFAQDMESAVKARLLDPESARFENVRERLGVNNSGKQERAICGTVRAKNRHGGYAGRTHFVFIPGPKPFLIFSGALDAVEEPVLDRLVGEGTYAKWCG